MVYISSYQQLKKFHVRRQFYIYQPFLTLSPNADLKSDVCRVVCVILRYYYADLFSTMKLLKEIKIIFKVSNHNMHTCFLLKILRIFKILSSNVTLLYKVTF